MRRARALPVYCAVAAADVILSGRGRRRGRLVTKPALMPMLAAHVADVGGRTSGGEGAAPPLILAGLGLSWLGDVALLAEGEGPLSGGLAAFLAAHCCYLAALAGRRGGGVRKAPWLAATYVAAWLALNIALWPRTGRLRVPVLVYGAALTAMAISALETGDPVVAAGGAAFLASDAMLALDTFAGVSSPAVDALVMLTYTVAQGLIAGGMSDGSRLDRGNPR